MKTTKHKGIDLAGIDIEIDPDAAKSYIEHRILMKKPLTQRAFDQAMSASLEAYKVGMTPTELIDFTVHKGWSGINLAYTAKAKDGEVQAIAEIKGRSTRSTSLAEETRDKSWAH